MEITEEEAKMQTLPKDRSMTVTFHGNIAILEMNFGENRLNLEFMKELNKALDTVESNPEIQALITTGRGKFYSNGIDLNFMSFVLQNDSSRELAFRRAHFRPLVERLATFPMPTIAAINGHCYAGGAVLALSHDYRIMQTKPGWFCLNEVRLGLEFSPNLIKLLQHALPSGRIYHEATILGKRYTADQALHAGIVASVCPAEDLLTHSQTYAKSVLNVGAYNREHLQNMKKSVLREILHSEDNNFVSFAKL